MPPNVLLFNAVIGFDPNESDLIQCVLLLTILFELTRVAAYLIFTSIAVGNE